MNVQDLINALKDFNPNDDVYMFCEGYDYTRFFKPVRFNDAGGKGVMFKGLKHDDID